MTLCTLSYQVVAVDEDCLRSQNYLMRGEERSPSCSSVLDSLANFRVGAPLRWG
ncbi:hypothetical protein [Nostoc sp. UHCC 0252]|uniref:hypothetical protein n=1 Tax=Nostoc sp. UHCC 0252 TaxID=3110241 RepID=UPI002B1F0090|nr:hypothetical protein [Nostoc sp. UHCC 0252]MEA5601156.1 hypothetical protein [Nostoc sp. UHCC 0252]